MFLLAYSVRRSRLGSRGPTELKDALAEFFKTFYKCRRGQGEKFSKRHILLPTFRLCGSGPT